MIALDSSLQQGLNISMSVFLIDGGVQLNEVDIVPEGDCGSSF